jgi:hypothetical protein
VMEPNLTEIHQSGNPWPTFMAYRNYWQNRHLSDHMPVVVEIPSA